MKKLFIILTILTIGCKKDKEYCWTFHTVQITDVQPHIPGYPQTVENTTEQCGLTEDEAQQVVVNTSTSSTSYSGGYSYSVYTNTTKAKK